MSKIVVTQSSAENGVVSIIIELCREMGHEAFYVSSPALVAQNAQEVLADVIITNFLPPETTRNFILRWQAQLPNVRTIIVSGTYLDLATEALNLGVFDYLSKPFKFSEFMVCIQRACSRN